MISLDCYIVVWHTYPVSLSFNPDRHESGGGRKDLLWLQGSNPGPGSPACVPRPGLACGMLGVCRVQRGFGRELYLFPARWAAILPQGLHQVSKEGYSMEEVSCAGWGSTATSLGSSRRQGCSVANTAVHGSASCTTVQVVMFD